MKLLSIIAAMCCAIPVLAHDFEADGIYYKIISNDDKTVSVTFKGDKFDTVQNEYAGNVVIPSAVKYDGKTYTVTEIGSSAFRGCDNLTGVTIPEGVTSIGIGAFSYCGGLTTIEIPEGVTAIGIGAFQKCIALESVVLPSTLSAVKWGTFALCATLTSVTVKSAQPAQISSDTFGDLDNKTLYVPKGSKEAYENAAFWSGFTTIVEQ